MSVALVTMDAAYGLRLARHHLMCASPEMRDPQPTSLRFSVVNILRPDFGRAAILNNSISPSREANIHSPIALPRDLSLSSTRLSPQSPPSLGFSCGLSSPIQRHSTLSRSGSLESLASSRSSVTGSTGTSAPSVSSTAESVSGDSSASSGSQSSPSLPQNGTSNQSLWPAWVYCTRYSDRPSSGPRTRRVKRPPKAEKSPTDDKRPRTAFSAEQLARLKREFAESRYLTERRRQQLSRDLGLNEAQIKIWFQNKRAKIKKASGQKNPLAIQLMAQGLYNHSTVPVDEDGEEIEPGKME